MSCSRLMTVCGALFVGAACAGDAARSAEVSIEYVAHASFRLTGPDGTRLLVDPFADGIWIGYAFPDSWKSADGYVITHPHYDHDSGEFLGMAPIWPDDAVVLRSPDDGRDIAEWTLRGVAGKHAGPYGTEFGQVNTIWIAETAGLRIAHWGDNEEASGELAAEIGPIDVLMLPIDDEEHILTFAEVEQTIAVLDPTVVIPMHFRHGDLEREADQPEDLGPIDAFAETRTDVLRAETHRVVLRGSELSPERVVLILDHAPEISQL